MIPWRRLFGRHFIEMPRFVHIDEIAGPDGFKILDAHREKWFFHGSFAGGHGVSTFFALQFSINNSG